MQLGKHLDRILLTLLAAMSFAGCSSRQSGNTMCLGGSNVCADTAVETRANSSTSSSSSSTSENQSTSANALTCSAAPSQNTVDIAQAFSVQVTTANAKGPFSVRDGTGNAVVASAASAATFFKQYNSAYAGKIVQESLLVQDTSGQFAYCMYQVKVSEVANTGSTLPPPPTLGCEITASPASPELGSIVDFTLTAKNNTGNAVFSQFYGSSDWLISDSYLKVISANQSHIQLIYKYAGTKNVSVRVYADGNSAVCSLAVTPASSLPPTPPPPTLACDISVNPLGLDKQSNVDRTISRATLAGSLSKVRVRPQGGKAPYTVQGVYAGAEFMPAIYPPPTYPTDVFTMATDPFERVVRFRQPGTWFVRATVQDSSGATVDCGSNYDVLPNSTWGASQLGGNGTLSRVRVLFGVSGATVQDFIPNANSTGTALGLGDFNADSKPDYVTLESTGGIDALRLYQGDVSAWYPGKVPALLWTIYAGLPSDGSERRLAIGDFNADGIADIAVSNGCTGPSGAAVTNPMIKIIDGSTRAISTLSPTCSGQLTAVGATASADINGDGYSDLAFISCDGSRVVSYNGKNLGTSGAPMSVLTLGSGSPRASLSLADMNLDGKAELIVTDQTGTQRIRVLDAASGALMTSIPTQSNWLRYQTANADFNEDGIPEILLATSASGVRPGWITILDGKSSMATGLAQILNQLTPFMGWNGSIAVAGGTAGY